MEVLSHIGARLGRRVVVERLPCIKSGGLGHQCISTGLVASLSAAQPPWLHLWGVAERSEAFKIMIASGNHSTTDVLISIGVRDYKIYFGGSKIDKILEKDNSMDIDTIKQAINLLENQF